MKLESFGLAALATLVTSVSVQAQTTGPDLLVPLPAPPAQPDVNLKRTFSFRLQNVKPSLMAFWLDPKNHAAPADLPGNAPGLSSPRSFIPGLPEDVDRVVPVDPQNTLLVFGTVKAVNQLRQIIDFLDRPQHRLEPEITLFWLDGPTGADWKSEHGQGINSLSITMNAQGVRVATEADLAQLDSLVRDGKALRVDNPPIQATAVPTPRVMVVPPSLSPPLSVPQLSIPNAADGKKFESPMPVWKADPQIDPGILPRSPLGDWKNGLGIDPRIQPKAVQPAVPPASAPPMRFFIVPELSGKDVFRLSNPGALAGNISLRLEEGKSWIISGQTLGLTPPSPRFSVAVLLVTSRVVNSSAAPGVTQP